MVIALAVVAGSAAVALARGGSAHASSYTGCSTTYYANQSCVLPNLVPLIATRSYDRAGTHRVCAGAELSSGTFYANYECGTGYVAHCYSGLTSLFGVVGSGDANAYSGYGTEVWNASCP
jgi:hypothetical protein